MVRAATSVWASRAGQNSLWQDIRRLLSFSLRPAESPLDLLGRDERILLIGHAAEVAGNDWFREHPRWADWLVSEGLTPDHCRNVYREWAEKQRSLQGWKAPRKCRNHSSRQRSR